MQTGIVMTSGVFDLFHYGHVKFLEAAAKLGEHLIVALNTDWSATQIKGKPIYSYAERAVILQSVKYVYEVIPLDDRNPCRLIEHIQPQFWVKGTEWAGKKIDEEIAMARHGGQVVYLPHAGQDVHTSGILKKIREIPNV